MNKLPSLHFSTGLSLPSVIAAKRAHFQIDFLQEYRTRLIADVVTGKLDVRGVAGTLPEVQPLAAEDDLNDNFDSDSALDELDAIFEKAES